MVHRLARHSVASTYVFLIDPLEASKISGFSRARWREKKGRSTSRSARCFARLVSLCSPVSDCPFSTARSKDSFFVTFSFLFSFFFFSHVPLHGERRKSRRSSRGLIRATRRDTRGGIRIRVPRGSRDNSLSRVFLFPKLRRDARRPFEVCPRLVLRRWGPKRAARFVRATQQGGLTKTTRTRDAKGVRRKGGSFKFAPARRSSLAACRVGPCAAPDRSSSPGRWRCS